jgi:lysozyme family protein
MSGDPFGSLTFRRPDGRTFTSGPPGLWESARARLSFLPWVRAPGTPTDRGP